MAEIEVRSVADLPFPELDRHTLLHLSPDRVDIDLENYGFGFGRVDKLALCELGGDRRTQVLDDVLVLALHAYEDPVIDDDVELAFWLDDEEYYEEEDDDDLDLVVTAPLALFLARRLPAIVAHVSVDRPPPAEIVLALCNPRKIVVTRPEGLKGPPIRYALGDCRSRMESDRADKEWDPDAMLCLDADEWLRIPAA